MWSQKTWQLSPGVQRLLVCKSRVVGRTTGVTPRWQSSAKSRHELYETLAKDNRESSWKPVYRLTVMPHIQAISRLKFTLTGLLLVACPPLALASHYDLVPNGLLVGFSLATLVSLATLIAFSQFSTKLVGVGLENQVEVQMSVD